MDTTLSRPPAGQLLDGRYRVEAWLAQGGMATVYLGTDTRLDRPVALKIARPELAGDEEFIRRFITEAHSVARLSSPHVVAVYDQGTDGQFLYLAMEYVRGQTLRELLRHRGRLEPRAALDIMEGVLAGLAAAHAAGIIHRDVKPENVLLSNANEVKVADFGLARAAAAASRTKSGMIIGTAAYLAPEQVSRSTSDARTDVYAAGIVLFEMLTGVQPHTGGSPLDVAYKHVNDVIPVPSSLQPGLPPALDALVALATSRDPDRRPADAGQFLRAITEVRRGTPVAGMPGAGDPGSHYLSGLPAAGGVLAAGAVAGDLLASGHAQQAGAHAAPPANGSYAGAAYPGSAYPGGTYPGGAYPGGAPSDGAYPGGAHPGGAPSDGAYPGGAYPGGAHSGGAHSGSAPSSGAHAGGVPSSEALASAAAPNGAHAAVPGTAEPWPDSSPWPDTGQDSPSWPSSAQTGPVQSPAASETAGADAWPFGITSADAAATTSAQAGQSGGGGTGLPDWPPKVPAWVYPETADTPGSEPEGSAPAGHALELASQAPQDVPFPWLGGHDGNEQAGPADFVPPGRTASGTAHAPSGTAYPPSGSTTYPPSGDAYQPPGNAYPPAGNPYPPSGGAHAGGAHAAGAHALSGGTSGTNHTLIVKPENLVTDSTGDHGRYGGRGGDYRRRAEPVLQRLLFSRKLVYIGGSALVLLIIVLMIWWLTGGQYTKVPQVHGMAAGVAKTELTNLGFVVKTGPGEHSTLPKGEILKTSPAIGTNASNGSTIQLIASLGPVQLQVPQVTGLPLAQAQAALKKAGLTAGSVSQATSSTIAAGIVISTNPVAGTSWPQPKPVGLTVSEGPPLQNLVGQQLSAAQGTAQASGYALNPVTDAKSNQPAGTITSQSPAPGTPIAPHEVVTVHVSSGPPQVAIPNVTGMNVNQAEKILSQAGFNVTVNTVTPGHRVISYSPTGQAPQGSTITLTVGFVFTLP